MTMVYVVVAVLVFILFLLFYIDQRVKYSRPHDNDEQTIWSMGNRKNHPAWAWMVSILLWTIMACIAYGTIQYLFYGHHGPHLASTLGLEDPHASDALEGGILEEVTEIGKMEKFRHFHNLVEDTTLKDKNPICYFCHGNFPHKRRRFIRTMMNMHTQFIGCFTCHVTGYDEKEIAFRWKNYSNNHTLGPPFGLAYNEDTGRLEETDDYYSKIIGFINKRGIEEMLEIPEDSPMALEYLAIRNKFSKDVALQGAFKNRIHKNVMPKGRFCTRCHTSEKESLLPFRSLGFSDQRVDDLTGLNIVGIIQKYKGFYIPSLYRGQDKEEEEQIKTLIGVEKKEKPRAPVGAAAFNPRAWWRDKYLKKEMAPEKMWAK